ncbi:hypothetical protein AD998_05975 [bacterium 336/3]|jgi:hypothetical protein|nr:hypothetical protein AD998_05975 [bacterium 336/3]
MKRIKRKNKLMTFLTHRNFFIKSLANYSLQILVGLGFFFLLQNCSKTIEPDGDRLGYNYFPLEIGKFVTWEIEEKNYTILDSTTNIYQIKEVVVDTFTNLSGQRQYVLERYKRANINQSWQIDSVWSAIRTGSQAIKYENNTPYIKLIFPTTNNQTWNGNAYNNYGEKTYKLVENKRTRKYGEITLPNTVKILMGNDSSLVTQVKREEVYALGVGLAYMQRINVRFKSDGPNLGKGIIESGKIEKFTIIEHGKE